MFARSGSSLGVPALANKAKKAMKDTKQMSLDLYSRPSTRLASRQLVDSTLAKTHGQGDAPENVAPSQSRSHAKWMTKGQTHREDTPDPTPTPTPGATPLRMVGSDGHAVATIDENEVTDDLDAQSRGSDALSEDASTASAADQQEDGPKLYATDAAVRGTPATPKGMPNIHMAEEGRICRKKAQLIEPEDMFDSDILAGALVQISLFPGLSQAVRSAVRVVAPLMVQPKQAGAEDAAAKNIVDQVVDRLAEVVKTATRAAVAEIKSSA